MELVGWGGREGGRSTRPNASTATCHPLVHTYVHGGLSGPLNRCQPGAPRQETCCSLWVGGGVSIAICGKMPPPTGTECTWTEGVSLWRRLEASDAVPLIPPSASFHPPARIRLQRQKSFMLFLQQRKSNF